MNTRAPHFLSPPPPNRSQLSNQLECCRKTKGGLDLPFFLLPSCRAYKCPHVGRKCTYFQAHVAYALHTLCTVCVLHHPTLVLKFSRQLLGEEYLFLLSDRRKIILHEFRTRVHVGEACMMHGSCVLFTVLQHRETRIVPRVSLRSGTSQTYLEGGGGRRKIPPHTVNE